MDTDRSALDAALNQNKADLLAAVQVVADRIQQLLNQISAGQQPADFSAELALLQEEHDALQQLTALGTPPPAPEPAP